MQSIKNFTRIIVVFVAMLTLAACSDNDNNTSSGGGGVGAKNIAETAIDAAPEFTTLVSALDAAGLVPTLSQGGPFTVFAPTNAAFAKIQSTVDTLTLSQLTAILNYHVVPGINGASAIPPTTGATPQISAAIPASNGVIFPISEVLLP